jgi:hypothetical protein
MASASLDPKGMVSVLPDPLGAGSTSPDTLGIGSASPDPWKSVQPQAGAQAPTEPTLPLTTTGVTVQAHSHAPNVIRVAGMTRRNPWP